MSGPQVTIQLGTATCQRHQYMAHHQSRPMQPECRDYQSQKYNTANLAYITLAMLRYTASPFCEMPQEISLSCYAALQHLPCRGAHNLEHSRSVRSESKRFVWGNTCLHFRPTRNVAITPGTFLLELHRSHEVSPGRRLQPHLSSRAVWSRSPSSVPGGQQRGRHD